MKKLISFNNSLTIIALLLLSSYISIGQVIFTETFGSSTTRQPSPYMPSGSFTYGDPTGNSNQKMIENNHYAVIDPTHIRDAWPVPAYWFWTGPEPTGNTFGGIGAAATSDHTGNTNGAVMAINGGVTLNTFYNRDVTISPGYCYRISYWIYLVNSPSQIQIEIRDVADADNGLTSAPLALSPIDYDYSSGRVWRKVSYDFNFPASCTSSSSISVRLKNALAQNSNNDFYIDDIVLERLGTCTSPSITCPVTSSPLPIKLFNLTANEQDGQIQVAWQTLQEINTDYFLVERSNNVRDFEVIAKVKAAGNTDNTLSYSITDTEPFANNNYYRLRTVDSDGTSEYSKIISVAVNDDKPKISVINPVENKTIDLSIANIDNPTFQLFDANGQVVAFSLTTTSEKYYQLKVDKSNYSGLIILKVYSGTSVFTKKLIIN